MAKQGTKKKTVGKVIRTVLSAILVILLAAILFLANTLLPNFARMVDNMMGYNQRVDNTGLDTTGLNLSYYELDYSAEEIGAAEQDLDRRIVAEGTVLLKNDGDVLPYPAGTTFSFFSANAAGGGSFIASFLGGDTTPLKDSFTAAGFGVNETLWDFYTKGAGKGYGLADGSISFGDDEDFAINECPLPVVLAGNGVEESLAGTVPVYVLRRVAGEGRDMPRSMYNHTDILEDKTKSYLEPDSVELEILQYLNDNFEDVVLLVNSNAALELGWVEQFPSIHAVVYSQGLRAAVAEVFSGAVNPSGRTVDTFAANALNSPAAQNFGDYAYFDEAGQPTLYNYVSYKEGIYVGYKYYETRYEDVVLGQGNAGEYSYASEVCYPFGFGLSYTSFAWDGYSLAWNGETATATMEVTNTGSVAGKEVVQLYAQSPYTEYDKANNVEKAAVELVGYGKTSELAPGESETVVIAFEREQLKAYDYTGAGTYILEPGEYYITAAANAHAATNNILAAKGKTMADGMTEEGNAALVQVYEPDIDAVDALAYSVDAYSGAEISNLFDDAHGGLTYLSRQDWLGTWPTHDGEVSGIISTWGNEINGVDAEGNPASYTYYKTAGGEEIARLDAYDALSPDDTSAFNDPIVYGADNGLGLIDLRGRDFDDPLWQDLLDQLTPEDYQVLITQSGYGTVALDSVGKPFCVDADTASGLIYGGTGFMFPAAMVLAQTWNQDLAYEFGRMIGNEALIGGAHGWYAPSMNIHRTPFSGRNGEYYSEDGFLSGVVAAAEIYGAAEKGVYAFIKHYAINDQENHRGDRDGQFGHATWVNEQAIREIYLKPFEMCMKADDVTLKYVRQNADGSFENATRQMRASQAVMSAFNRIGYTWTGGSHALITGILREEWGFNGFVITDNANTGLFMDAYQMIAAGADAKLTSEAESARYTFNPEDTAEYHYGRQAMHRMLFTIANSKAMDGAMPGSTFVQGMQFSQIARIIINVVAILLILLMVLLTIRRFKPKKDRVIVVREGAEK